MLMRFFLLAIFLALLATTAAADSSVPDPEPAAVPGSSAGRNSLLGYWGRLSTTDMASSMLYNLNYTPTQGKPPFDNDTLGVVFQHDLGQVASNLRGLLDMGIAERYGHYLVCCLQVPDQVPHPDTTVRFDSRIFSTEVWIGGTLRRERYRLGSYTHVEFAVTLGFSGETRTIGRERQREMDKGGNAHFLTYVAPELGFSFDSLPRWEFVLRDPHRSGFFGTFGNMREGYNADTIGARYFF